MTVTIQKIVNQAILLKECWSVIVLTDATRTEGKFNRVHRVTYFLIFQADIQPTRTVSQFKRLLQRAQRTAKGVIPAYGIGVQLVQLGSSVNFQTIKKFNQVNSPVRILSNGIPGLTN